MKRALLALALLSPLLGCGPDCDKFCRGWVDCRNSFVPPPAPLLNLDQCVQSCDEVGSDNAAFINCVNDKSCDDIKAGHCQIPSVLPGIVQ
jgi:hypothetical protein